MRIVTPDRQVLGISANLPTSLTTGGANAKGSYSSLGTLDFRTSALRIFCRGNTVSRAYRLDIAINTGGSDTIVAEDLYFTSQAAGTSGGIEMLVPLDLPSGAVVKARAQASSASAAAYVCATAYAQAPGLAKGGSKLRALTDFTNSQPTNLITLTGTTQTGWTQICASTPYEANTLFVTLGDGADGARTAGTLAVEIGIGGSGSEVAIDTVGGSNQSPGLAVARIPIVIPAGTRLSARATASAAATDSLGVACYGLVA